MTELNISEHFTWKEVSFSETAQRLGIDNTIPDELKPAAQKTATGMEKVRALLGVPIFPHSWYRGPALQALPQFRNPKSQHPKAEAVDFVAPNYGTPLEICRKIIKYADLVRFDQLILEHSWVHISFCSVPGVKPRGQVLSLLKSGDYASGLTDLEGKPL